MLVKSMLMERYVREYVWKFMLCVFSPTNFSNIHLNFCFRQHAATLSQYHCAPVKHKTDRPPNGIEFERKLKIRILYCIFYFIYFDEKTRWFNLKIRYLKKLRDANCIYIYKIQYYIRFKFSIGLFHGFLMSSIQLRNYFILFLKYQPV